MMSKIAWLGRRIRWRKRANMGNVSSEDSESSASRDSEEGEEEENDNTAARRHSQGRKQMSWKNTCTLITVLQEPNISGKKALKKVMKLLMEGAKPNIADENQETALHHAVKREWVNICVTLLDTGADATRVNADGLTPLHIAFYGVKNDEISAMLLAYMPPSKVRDLYIAGHDQDKADFNFQQPLKDGWTKTTWSLLDSVVNPHVTPEGTQVVCYGILESDSSGRTPDHKLFDAKGSSVFEIMLNLGGAPEFLDHEAMRLLTLRAWNSGIKTIYIVHTVLHILSVLCLLYAAVLATVVADPAHYTSPADYSRAVAEILAYSVIFIRFYLEIRQIIMRGWRYFTDHFSLNDLAAVIVLLLVIPLRFTHNKAQWLVFALGYSLWYIRLFHYVIIVPTFGIYVRIIWLVFKNDLMPFVLVFILIMMGFSGAQMLANRWDAAMGWSAMGNTTNMTFPNTNMFPKSNASYLGVLATLGKSLFDPQETVEYTGITNGTAYFGTILMFAYLFICLVLFVNMLIAQITTTFTEKSSHAVRERYFTMMWMIARVKLTSPLFQCLRKIQEGKCCGRCKGDKYLHYTPCEYVDIAKIIGSRNSVGDACDERGKRQHIQDAMTQLDARMRSLETSVERLVQLQLGVKQ